MLKKFLIISCVTGILMAWVAPSHAALFDITDSTLPHFGDFYNQNYPGDYSNISRDFFSVPGDFGWHYSPSYGPSISGILLNPNSYVVTTLRFQVHSSPFKDFLLQGSTDTTDGFNGNWDTLLSSTVTERTEQAIQAWSFSNSNSYSAYRIYALNDYKGEPPYYPIGWAMYRWELLADDGSSVIPEPATLLLFGTGLVGAFLRRRRA